MIVPMKKVSLLVLAREQEQALEALRKTGVLHVEKQIASSPDISALQNTISKVDSALSVLIDSKVDVKQKQVDWVDQSTTLNFVDAILSVKEDRRNAFENRSVCSNEISRISSWGDFNPTALEDLQKQGLRLLPYEMEVKEYKLLDSSIRTIVLSKDKKLIRFVICLFEGEPVPELGPEAREFILPQKSILELTKEIEKANAQLEKTLNQISDFGKYYTVLQDFKKELLQELEFETIKAGMPLIALEETSDSRSTDIVWLSGYLPVQAQTILSKVAKEQGWALAFSEPSEDDNVPTQLKNNRFVNLISPLLDFLGTVPGYRELDISMWFLLFFGLFFAMIFGDGGYGALLVLISLGLIGSTIKKGKKPGTALYMFLYLGLMTVLWGVATCTWFGIPLDVLPAFFKQIAIPAISNENPNAAENIKIFCFAIGLAQISLAHVIGFIRSRGSLKMIGEFGALMLAIGMFYVVLSLVVDATKYPLTSSFGTMMIGFVLGGFLLNFLFINYSDSFGGGVIESLKNIITMILGVVNMFGDIMSYIRLWAVGLAGAAISQTINAMAGPILGGFIIFAGIILLLFGHGLNMVMNVLSVIVHGVRLNTLEFSNHLGLTWSGYKYEPFSETVRK